MVNDESFTIKYEIYVQKNKLKYEFTDEEKQKLRPIAETLAILDGNAFFGTLLTNNKEWYEQYLPEAHYLFEYCGGKNPYASFNMNKEEKND